ncbi:MAG: hypothetical protein Q9163_005096 [Psora crenata]
MSAPKEPTLFHRIKGQASILSLLISGSKIFAGTQDGDLLVWSLETYELIASVHAHRSSLLGLCLSDNGELLFSSAGDALVNVWDASTLQRLYSIYSKYDVGDVFCVAYSSAMQSVYLGAQNTSIQWYDLSRKDLRPAPDPTAHPSYRNHRFFDSKGPTGVSTPRRPSANEYRNFGGQELEIDKDHIVQYAHYGYVYCMVLAKGLSHQHPGGETLISGGGDGCIKLWSVDHLAEGAINQSATLQNGDESVHALAIDATLLYSGRLGGDVNVWDLDTRQLIRRVKAHTDDVLTITVGHDLIFTGSSNGIAKIFNLHHANVSEWRAHDHLVLASAVASSNNHELYITGGNDGCIAVWDISNCFDRPRKGTITSNEELVLALEKFVSYQTVSGRPDHAHDCRRGASFLKSLFKRFGAETELFSTTGGMNPIVFARFPSSRHPATKRKTIMFYGHYDVVSADSGGQGWRSDPFALQATNGYLYGRGVSDNKGPVLAALYAAADIKRQRHLDADIVFLIEGEEESGSRGFEEAITRNRHIIGNVDWILLANSYWLTDDIPCLTYGLRGVIRATLGIQSQRPDLHSGVDGSQLVHEAMKDLIAVLAKLSGPNGTIAIPGFYDDIPAITQTASERYDIISKTLLQQNPSLGIAESLKASFKARWREPSFTLHRINSSGSASSSTIPRMAEADFSFRLVPKQTTSKIEQSLRKHVEMTFAQLRSSNQMSLRIERKAEPWLGDPNNLLFRTLEKALMEAWAPACSQDHPVIVVPARDHGPSSKQNSTQSAESPDADSATSSTLSSRVDLGSPIDEGIQPPSPRLQRPLLPIQKPLYIREGGSIPAIRFLETVFDAPAAHLPCGQASDSAHLDNERLRLLNLYKAREIFQKVFIELGSK